MYYVLYFIIHTSVGLLDFWMFRWSSEKPCQDQRRFPACSWRTNASKYDGQWSMGQPGPVKAARYDDVDHHQDGDCL